MKKSGHLFIVIHARHASFRFTDGARRHTGSNPHTGDVASASAQVDNFTESFKPATVEIVFDIPYVSRYT
jgi:hypothetical protein